MNIDMAEDETEDRVYCARCVQHDEQLERVAHQQSQMRHEAQDEARRLRAVLKDIFDIASEPQSGTCDFEKRLSAAVQLGRIKGLAQFHWEWR